MRQAELDARHQHRADDDGQPDRENGESRVEGRAHLRLVVPRALRIEADRRKPDPVEDCGLDDEAKRKREREPAIFLRPQEFRDDQPDHEIEEGVNHEGDQHLHARCLPGRARAQERAVRVPSRRNHQGAARRVIRA